MYRLFQLCLALVMGAGASQAPEFSQQYRQRLAGAVAELRIIVEDFDALARQHGLDRERALEAFAGTTSDFLRARGERFARTIARYERLSAHLEALEAAPPAERPFLMFAEADPVLLRGAWQDYRPAIPLGAEGWIYGILGGVFGLGGAFAAGGLKRRPRMRRP